MLHRPLPRAAGVIVVAIAAVTVAACSSSSGGGGTTTAPPATAVTTTTVPPAAPTSVAASSPSASASTSSAAGSGSGGSAGPTACRESQLRAQIDPRPVGGATANDKAVIVQFVNTSSTSCTMHGYPGAAILDASGHQLVQATRTLRGKVLGLPTSVSTLPTVTLEPGAVASAGIEGVNNQKPGTAQAGCDVRYPRILVTPPNTTIAVPFTVTWPACYTFTVHPTNLDTSAN